LTAAHKCRTLAIMNDDLLKNSLLNRFVRYAAIGSQSDMPRADSGIFPSTDCQKDIAKALAEELRSLGIEDVTLDPNFYVIARIPATPGFERAPSFGLSAHFDTAMDAPGDNVKPQIHKDWNGEPIRLEGGFALDPANDPILDSCRGHTIITSDGTTLLGADDKAGVAGIVTLAEYLIAHPEVSHGPIEMLFSPDEETGHGMDHVPLNLLTSKAFYTVDGGQEGELETECFNAWKAEIEFTGISLHTGHARGRMVNAVSMASAFVASLPAQESPEATDGYYGFYAPINIEGSIESAKATLFLRDFDRAGMDRRLETVDVLAKAIEARFPGGKVSVKRTMQYLNMKQKLDAAPEILAKLEKAAANAGIPTHLNPIRGGTDGSRLTEMGIPTPNVFTGGHNYHSRTEWASLEQMYGMLRTLIELAKCWSE